MGFLLSRLPSISCLAYILKILGLILSNTVFYPYHLSTPSDLFKRFGTFGALLYSLHFYFIFPSQLLDRKVDWADGKPPLLPQTYESSGWNTLRHGRERAIFHGPETKSKHIDKRVSSSYSHTAGQTGKAAYITDADSRILMPYRVTNARIVENWKWSPTLKKAVRKRVCKS